MKKKKDIEKEQYKKELRKLLRNGKVTIYQIVTKVSPSGMSRHIKNFIAIKGEIISIDYQINKVLEHVRLSDNGLFISGCGMDMGFEIVYSLSRRLYTEKEALKLINRKDSGYILKQRWI